MYVSVDLEVGATVEMTVEDDTEPSQEPPTLSASRVGSDGESDSNDEAESELTIDMDADLDANDADSSAATCQNNNVSEERKIQEYMSRKDTAVIFPEPVEAVSKESGDNKQGQSAGCFASRSGTRCRLK